MAVAAPLDEYAVTAGRFRCRKCDVTRVVNAHIIDVRKGCAVCPCCDYPGIRCEGSLPAASEKSSAADSSIVVDHRIEETVNVWVGRVDHVRDTLIAHEKACG